MKKQDTELRMPAKKFDRMMRRALQTPPPKVEPGKAKPEKTKRSK